MAQLGGEDLERRLAAADLFLGEVDVPHAAAADFLVQNPFAEPIAEFICRRPEIVGRSITGASVGRVPPPCRRAGQDPVQAVHIVPQPQLHVVLRVPDDADGTGLHPNRE